MRIQNENFTEEVMAKITSFNFWKTLLGVITGSIVGTLIGELSHGINGLSWLSLGRTVGIDPPFGINLGFITFTIGFTISVNLAIILFIIIFVLLFRKIF